jgi:hypothetical protein
LTEFYAQLTEEKDRTRGSSRIHQLPTLQTILGVFGDGTISRGLWASRSPDLTPCDFNIWGNLIPHTEEELKENIRKEILEIPQEELLRVNFSLFKRYRECAREQRHNFQHLSQKGKFVLLFLWTNT